jgi:cation:H+ antiporter
MLLPIVLLLVGFAILIKGADFLVNGASSLAKKYGISNLAIGLTVVAFGTSMPELIVSVIASLGGKNDAAFGNIIGSNNFNLLFILGVCGLIYPLVVQRNTVKYEVPLSLLAALVLFLVVNDTMLWGANENSMSRIDAFILLLFFALFMFYIYRTMKNTSDYGDNGADPIKIYTPLVSSGLALLGLVMLIGGGKLVVDNAVDIAQQLKVSDKLIGLTILAIGTSLPELATSAVAAYRKNTDIAIGNVIGSNIFNIFFILGVAGFIRETPFNVAMNFDLYVLGASTVVLMIFMFTLNTRKLDRWEAAIMLALYIVYTVCLIGIENGSITF